MSKKRKIIKKVCSIGTMGLLAGGIITTEPNLMVALALDGSVEEQQDPAAVMEDTAAPEEMEQKPEDADPTATAPQETSQETPAIDLQPAEEPENPDDSGSTAEPENPNDSEGENEPENPDGTEGENEPENPNGTEGEKEPENPNGTEGENKPENPNGTEGENEPEKPNGSEGGEEPENPNGSEGEGEPENPNDSEGETKPENPDGSQDAAKPGDSDSSADMSDPSGTDNIKDPSDMGNSDNKNDFTDSDYPDYLFKPNDFNHPNSSVVLGYMPGFNQPDIQFTLPEETGNNDISPEGVVSEELEPGRTNTAAQILNKKLVKLPKMVEDFRFWTVTRKYAFAKEDLLLREEIPKQGEEDKVREIGRIQKNGLLYVLKEEKDGWFYVESGKVRGFVKSEEVITGEEAKGQLELYQRFAKKAARLAEQEYTGIEGTVPMAEEIVPWQENRAFTYLRATVNQTVIEKDYAVAGKTPVKVRENKNTDSRIIGIIPAGGLCYIIKDKDQDWIYIESGDVRGFVEKKSVQYGEEIKKQVEEKKEESFALAEKKIEPQENKACYYTLTSIKSGIPGGEIRKSVVEFASQFIGNPYVWGGTSLTEGADCSGFVQSVFKQYGYELPRVACDQAEYGTKIPVEDALPGDLIFYEKGGYINHVVMYAGEGKTVEAQSSKTGIVCADVRTDRAVWATRFLKDNDYGYAGGGISEVNATPGMYGKYLGNYQLTYYCACELCCDVETGITATGAPVVEGRTIAVDPSVIPYGTEVIIGGHIFTAEDCGGAIKGNHIDIYVNDHATASALGVNYADVYVKK